MIKVKESATKILLEGPPHELTTLIESMRFRPDDYWRSEAYVLYKSTGGQAGWDGYNYPLKRLPNDATKAIALRGHLEQVKALCQAHQIDLDTQACLTSPFVGLTVDDIPDDVVKAPFLLDVSQRRCIAAWLERGNCIHHVTVAAGKTVMMAAAAAMILKRLPNARLLYFTPTERLVRQVTTELKKFLPWAKISQYGGGSRDKTGEHIVVATNAILWRNFKELKQTGWFKSFVGILFDECQYVGSNSTEKILLEIPAYFRLGASDTTKEHDKVRSTKIIGHLGPWAEVIETHELISAGRAAKPTLYLVDVNEWTNKFKDETHSAEPGSDAWVLLAGQWKRGAYLGPVVEEVTTPGRAGKPDRVDVVQVQNLHRIQLDGEELQVNSRWCLLARLYDRAIIRFKERNELIAQWAAYYSGKQFPTLVVATRTLHVYILEAVIKSKVDPNLVRVLFSEHSSKERDETFAWFRSTPGSVLITPLVQVGVSIPEIRGGVIADPISDPERARQVIGRFIRKKEVDNRCEITLFVDRQHATLRRNAIKLVKYLETVRGYSFYWPLHGPDTISKALHYEASALALAGGG